MNPARRSCSVRPSPQLSVALALALVWVRSAQASDASHPILADADARITRNRTAPLTVEVVDAAGKPAPGVAVQLEHLRHRFFFGAGFDRRLLPREDETESDRRHRDLFLRLFNYSTVHLYWGGYERREGEPDHAARIRAAQWLRDQGLTPRGHPIFWNQDNTLPRWLRDRDPGPDELRSLFDRRLQQMSETVLPTLRDVDVFNELAHWERFTNSLTRLFQKQGKVEVVSHYLRETKRLNPSILTVVNDYDTSVAFADLLRRLLDAGAPIDIIGQQSHMHDGNWPVEKVWEILERLSRLGRPVLLTELSVLSGPRKKTDFLNPVPDWNTDAEHEFKQAEYIETFYRLAYSHSNCVGVVIWNYSDRDAWLHAPVGVVRKDGSPKPSFERLDALINRHWRTRGDWVTDGRGRVTVTNAFEGAYRIASGSASATGDHSVAKPLTLTLRSSKE